MEVEQMKRYALEEGFAKAEVVDTSHIPFDFSFRQFCNGEQCARYGKNYTCPPHCDAPEVMKERIMAHRKALVVQSLVELPEQMDMACYRQAEQKHNCGIIHLTRRLQREGCPGFMVGASGCALCPPCAITKGEPCPQPEQRFSGMSAYCVFVKKLAEQCGMAYDMEPGRIPIFGMFIFE